jgi:aminopeptidase-like protein
MGPLTALSVSLLALKLGGVSTVGWGLVVLPACMQGVINFLQAYRQKQELDRLVAMIEENRDKEE